MIKVQSAILCTKVILLCFILIIPTFALEPFCSSRCADYIGACFGANSNQCYACEQTIFHISSDDGQCQPIFQRGILFQQLTNTAMDLTGYSTSKPTSLVCSQYLFSGTYTKDDYISKTFSNIPENHYQLIIRFGVGFMGDWDAHDQILMEVDGTNYSQSYVGCYQTQPICFTNGNDCIKIVDKRIPHFSKNVSIKITSSITEVDPAFQFWGIKDLMITAKLCHSKCQTCFGPTAGECITCADGYFLWGNLCIKSCQNLYLPSKRMCVNECPVGTFQNDKKQCFSCEQNCLVCSNVIGCQIWSNKKSGVIWQQNKMFWILLIIVIFLTIFYLLYECILRKYFKVSSDSDINRRLITDSTMEQVKQRYNHKTDGSTDSKDKDKKSPHENKMEENNEYFQTKGVIFEQSGLNWAEQIPTIEQIVITNEQNSQKRKKKKGRQFRGTHSVQMTGTVQNMTQYSNGTINN